MNRILLSSFALVGLTVPVGATAITVYLSPPGEQSAHSSVGAVTTETFNAPAATGNYTSNYVGAIGTYQLSTTSAFRIQGADQYGGASGTQYMTFGAQSGTSGAFSLVLSGPQAYFGLWWSAGDNRNTLSFYSGADLIGTYTTSTVVSMLSASTVQAIDGTVYNTSNYRGNPNTGQNTGENYTYLNFFASGGTFDRVVFGNSNSTSTGFESDNHSVRATVSAPGGPLVNAGTIGTPEPGSFMLLGAGLVALGMIKVRSKK